MSDKDLQKLKRIELLEILVEQGKTIERLEQELAEANKKLEERNLNLSKAGSIAEAAIQVTGVLEAAQSAAQIYICNVKKMEQSTKERCDEMERKSLEKCQNMILDAEKAVNERWADISNRLEEFYNTHKGMKEILYIIGNYMKDIP